MAKIKDAAQAVPLPQGVARIVMCGNCALPILHGWSQSPKGPVCDKCWRGYMGEGWPT